MAKLSTVFDDFEDGTLNTTLWNDSTSATEASGYVSIPQDSNYDFRLGNTTNYDFTSDTFQCEVTFPTTAVSGIEQYVKIYNGADIIHMGRFSTSIGYDYGANSEYVTYNATNHRFWRIRTTASQIFFETSADGNTWNNPFTTGVQTLLGWNHASVKLYFYNGYFSGAGGGNMRIMQVGANNTVAVTGADTGAGTESAFISLSDGDTSLGTENQSISASSSDSDTSTGTEIQSVAVSDSDTSLGTDSNSVSVPSSDSDSSGAGAETQSVAASLSDAETGLGTESQTLAVTLSDSDTALGTDTGFVPTDPLDNDGGSGGESESVYRLNAPATERSLVMGPGSLWIAPFGALEPANGAVGSDPDTGVWTDLGGLLGGVELTVDQEFIEVELKQLPDKPMKRLKRRRLSIKTQVAETTLANLAYALNDTTAVTGTAFEPSARSEASALTYNALIVDGWAPNFKPGGRHKRRRLIIRKCLSIDQVQLAYKKDGQSVYTVTWSCHYVDASTPIFRVIDEA